METTITINEKEAVIVTTMTNALQLVQKNSNCETIIDGDTVTLKYGVDQLNTITALMKTSKRRTN